MRPLLRYDVAGGDREDHDMTVPNTDDPRVTTVKQEILRALSALPDDAGYEEAFEILHVLHKIHLGLQQLDAGMGVSHEEVVARMAKWLT